MKISDIKKNMIDWNDFYGGDIPDKEAIKNAKTKEELSEILNNHVKLMENTLSDAISHLESFKQELGLN